MPDLISPALASDWIQNLGKKLAGIRKERKIEIIKISDEFGDVELLAKHYIDPDCQQFNPADLDEDEPTTSLRTPVRQWVSEFLSGEFRNRDGRHVVFFLSDAGMGKTSLLAMLKLSHLLSFWPSKLDFQLLKLGPDTLDRITAMTNRGGTVLLLDSLDEDPEAWGKIAPRLRELLKATENFRQVFVTCRTQFFPKGSDAPIEGSGKVVVESYNCHLLYLSPFSDDQIHQYLEKIYPSTLLSKVRDWLGNRECQVDKAKRVIQPMKSLRMRPMLLAYVQDLMESDIKNWSEFSIYEALVEHWLMREVRKQGAANDKREELWAACQHLARYFLENDLRSISLTGLARVLGGHSSGLQGVDVGGRSLLNRTSDGDFRFAHYTVQEFLVAHWLVANPRTSVPRTTVQISNFLASWLLESPRERSKFIAGRREAFPLHGASLRNANLRQATLASIDFQQAHLEGADLSGADLRYAHLEGAHLEGANLESAHLGHASLAGTHLDGAHMKSANLGGAHLDGAILKDANLESAHLRDASLVGANLGGAHLDGAHFEGAILDGANLEAANLEGANW